MLIQEIAPKKHPPSESDLQTWLGMVEEIARARNLVAIYDSEENQDLDSVILKVLFQAGSHEGVDDRGMGEVKLAIAWNRIDMVEETIFKSKTGLVSLTQQDLKYLMPVALSLNRVEFVKTFMQKGLILRDFLTVPQLLLMYNQAVCVKSN